MKSALKLFSLFVFVFSVFTFAQTHRFIYQYQYKTDSLSDKYQKTEMILDLNPEDVKFFEYAYAENDSLNKVRNYRNTVWNDTPALIRMKNSNTNTNFALLNDYFSYTTEDPIQWKLSDETKQHGGYTLQKATTDFGGRSWTAWFTKDINLSEGPYKFRGLPGLVFEVEDTKGNFKFSLSRSYKLDKTYNTIDFLEHHGGKKALPTTQKIINKKLMEFFNDPLQDFKQQYIESKGQGTFSVMNVKITSVDQFKELTEKYQEMLRKEYNPIEIDKAVKYPVK